MDEILDIIYKYQRKIVEYNICSEKYDNLKKNINYLMSNEETKLMAETMKSSVDIMDEKVKEISKEKEEIKKDIFDKVSKLNDSDKEELIKRLEAYTKTDSTYNDIYNEIKTII